MDGSTEDGTTRIMLTTCLVGLVAQLVFAEYGMRTGTPTWASLGWMASVIVAVATIMHGAAGRMSTAKTTKLVAIGVALQTLALLATYRA